MKWDNVPGLILALVGLGIFVAIAVYILSKIREGQKNDDSDPSELMTRFSELYRAGEITPEEYKAIKARLAAALAAVPSREEKAEPRSKKGEKPFDRDAELERLLNS